MSRYFMSSARLGFRAWGPADLPLARSLWGDPQVTRHFAREPWSEAQVAARLADEASNQETLGVSYWPMFRLPDGAFVGAAGLKPFPDEAGVFVTGFHLRPQFWGAGYATEAAMTVIQHAFLHRNLRELFAGHHPDHHASRRILENLGFRHTGERLYEPTGLMDRVYRLTPPEYAAKAGPYLFQKMRADDFPLFSGWLDRPHVAAQWDDRRSLEAVTAKYTPELDSVQVSRYIVWFADRPIGFIQSYVAMGHPEFWPDERDPGTVGVDMFLAEGDGLGRGTGTAVLKHFVARLFSDPSVTRLQIDPAPDNARAIRCYEKAGFAAQGVISTPDGPALLMRLPRPVKA